MSEAPQKRSWDRPEGMSDADWMNTRVARVSERRYDWNALKFQADHDPKSKRAQKRFIGTGATGVAHDANVIPAEHFTLSNMIFPAGAVGPMHLHVDAEEVFFVLRGKIKVVTPGCVGWVKRSADPTPHRVGLSGLRWRSTQPTERRRAWQ